MKGYGWEPYFVEGEDIDEMQELLAKTLDEVINNCIDLQHTMYIDLDINESDFKLYELHFVFR